MTVEGLEALGIMSASQFAKSKQALKNFKSDKDLIQKKDWSFTISSWNSGLIMMVSNAYR